MSKGKSQDVLCCCEYINQEGERSHLLACLCECDALDEAADRCFTCKPIPGDITDRFCSTIQDRTRIPWLSGRGAMKIRFDVVLPIVAVPFFIYLGTLNPVMTFLVVFGSPLFLLCIYRCWSRSNSNFRRTKLFFTWALFSILFCYLTLLICLIILRKVYLWELMTLTSLFLLLLYALVLVKTNVGTVRRTDHSKQSGNAIALMNSLKGNSGNLTMTSGKCHRKSRSFSGVEYDGVSNESATRNATELPNVKDFSWCKICEIEQPPRSAHCPVCNVCVLGRDHHCVWIDECIGSANHRAFFLGVTIFLVTGVYGVHLALTSVCTPEMYWNWFLLPNDCRFVYEDPLFSWVFSGTMYALFSILLMALVWCHQVILISQNVTGYELHKAQSQKAVSFFFFAPRLKFNRGLILNWSDFLSGRRHRSQNFFSDRDKLCMV